MIHFSCICGHPFDLPEERAGDAFQCPVCMRLVDVPPLDELNAFEDDGTLKMKDAEEIPTALKKKIREHAHQEDLRQTVDDFFALDDAPRIDAPPTDLPPRYDPETGELLVAVEVVPDQRIAPQDIPMAKPALNYSSNSTIEPISRGEVSWWQAPFRIITGTSLMAMFFVFIMHVLVQAFMLVPVANILLLPIVFIIVLMVMAHYGNVMEEVGPANRDEVPVLLRNASFREDIWHPLFGLFLGFVFSFMPVIVALMFGFGPAMQKHPWIMIALNVWGLFVFPAASFTAITSGALQNMLPQHVFAVIKAAPGRYLLVFIAFMVAMTAYSTFIGGLAFTSLAVLTSAAGLIPWRQLALTGAVMCGVMWVAIYSMHLAAMWMGLIYRSEHARFHWVLQEHQKRVRTDTLAQIQDMRRRGDPRLKRKIDPERLQAVRDAESARRATHAESMRKI